MKIENILSDIELEKRLNKLRKSNWKIDKLAKGSKCDTAKEIIDNWHTQTRLQFLKLMGIRENKEFKGVYHNFNSIIFKSKSKLKMEGKEQKAPQVQNVQEVVKKPKTSKQTKLEIAFKAYISAKEREAAIKEQLKPITVEVKAHQETVNELAAELMEAEATELIIGDLGKVVKKYSHVPKIEGEITLSGFVKMAKNAMKNDLPIFKGKLSMTGIKGMIDNKTALSVFKGDKLEKGKFDKKIRKALSRFGFRGFVKQISFAIVPK